MRLSIFPSMVCVSFGSGGNGGKGGKKERIKGFSEKSRLNMIKFMHSIEFSGGVLITLTYGGDWRSEALETKKHLQAWRRYFEKKYGRVRSIWKLELQLRGAPHYHIFVLDEVFIDIRDAGRVWHKIVGSIQDVHEKIGVDVKKVGGGSDVRNVGKYVGKYVSKIVSEEEEDEIGYRGRYWGHWNVDAPSPVVVNVERGLEAEFLTEQKLINGVNVGVWMTESEYGYTLFTGDVGTRNSGEKTIDIVERLVYSS